ncbi:MAG: MFS transporter [Flavobacteriaceae bacterium]|nr:MFS transporter [Flavobacteriaceae bacterium]
MKLFLYLNRKIAQPYFNAFKGLSREVWWLSLITLINRAGTMVIPFLSLYLTKDLGFSLSKVGWIMTAFGLGSVIGSWLGGRLTDKIGYYKVMVFSLITTGFFFVGLQYLKTFEKMLLGIFSVMLVADMFRPAMFVAMSAYSKPENKTRTVTLIRLAINLGFSAGPAIGGLIITSIGYNGLFWIDGITCFLAGILLLQVLNPKKARVQDEIKVENPISPLNDKAFIVFLGAMFLFGFIFLQYFSTIPLYYKDDQHLSEFEIGLLMAMNGFVIFLLEMPFIKKLEDGGKSKTYLMVQGAILLGASFLVLNLSGWIGVLVIGMLFMTVGEMILFPFSNSFVIDRARKGKQGQFMALYTISFSISHIFAHNAGMQLISNIGYEMTWYLMTFLSMLCILLLWRLNAITKQEYVKNA